MTSTRTAGRVAVLASRVRSDEKRIFAALDRRGIVHEHVDSRSAYWELNGPAPRWPLVLNREIGYTRALYAARAFEAAGCRVINSARATEICGDKWRTSMDLCAAGLPVPRTALGATPDAALEAMEDMGYPVVIKPLVGSWGRLVTAISDRAMATAVLEHIAALPSPQAHVIYVQRLVPKADRDIRVIVVGGQVLGAVYRCAQDWRTNVARGAVTRRCTLTPGIEALALRAAEVVGADVAGVDIVEDTDGRLLLLEVNHGVEFTGFQEVAQCDVAERLADHLTQEVAACAA